jgi:hydrogenase-4 component B
VWNHAVFKALLFLSAGSVIHAAHTREIDHLGGLAKPMPWTALSFLVGAVAICGLPPLNGFVSEFLIYLGLFDTLDDDRRVSYAGAAFAAPALALIGALAVACFVKVYGAIFLGTARSRHALVAHESPRSMLGPVVTLALCCLVIGVAPIVVVPMLGSAISAWDPEVPDAATHLVKLAPWWWITVMGLVLIAGLAGVARVLERRWRLGLTADGTTWGCGYIAPTPRMQYTSSSFAEMLVGLFAWVLRPRIRRTKAMPLFPEKAEFRSEVPDTVLEGAVMPAFGFTGWLFSWFRVIQGGSIQLYLLYIFLALIALLLWR